MAFILLKLTYVLLPIGPGKMAPTMHLIINPFSNIDFFI